MKTAGMVATALILVALAGCTDDEPSGDAAACETPPAVPVGQHPVATIKTNLGTMEADLFAEMAPQTVANFVCLAEAGYFDGIHFHRIISGFMMQGGDPNTLDDEPGNDGHGGPGYDIDDEFHHALRHDEPGLLSMANAGRGTGGSQFFVTFTATPHLDDRHTVFGQVRSMEVPDRVDEEAASPSGTPRKEVVMQEATIRYEDLQVTRQPGLRLSTPDDTHSVPLEGGTTQFITVVENLGDLRAEVTIEAEGEQANVEEGFDTFTLPARQRAVVVIDVTATETASFNVTATSGEVADTLELFVIASADVGPETVTAGDEVSAHYIGMTPDGRFFDTSLLQVANTAEEEDRWFERFGKRSDAGYRSFSFTTGSGVIQGFTELAVGTPEGGTAAGRMPPAKAYGSGGCPPNEPCLRGMSLVFQLEILEIVE